MKNGIILIISEEGIENNGNNQRENESNIKRKLAKIMPNGRRQSVTSLASWRNRKRLAVSHLAK